MALSHKKPLMSEVYGMCDPYTDVLYCSNEISVGRHCIGIGGGGGDQKCYFLSEHHSYDHEGF